MAILDYRNNPVECEHKQTRIVARPELDPQVYELIKQDIARYRKSFGKGFDGSCGKQIVRGNAYWVTSHSSDPDDITIEEYIPKEKKRKCKK